MGELTRIATSHNQSIARTTSARGGEDLGLGAGGEGGDAVRMEEEQTLAPLPELSSGRKWAMLAIFSLSPVPRKGQG